MNAIRIHETGGPEVLRWESIDTPRPGAGEIRVRHTAIGLNFIDTYHRSGLYKIPLPAVIGSEAAGVIEEVGEGVTNLSVGDRVAYATGPIGSYAEERTMPAAYVVKIPDAVDDRSAAASMLKGMTAQYLVRRTHDVKKGDVVLVHAAAGGVGTILCQWAKHHGATVIGTVGSEEKAKLARENGCDHVILYRSEDTQKRVRAITNGAGAHVVYDGVGKDTWDASLDSLRPRGLMVQYGNASGAVPPIAPLALMQKGSLFLTRPRLGDYVLTREELEATARDLFDVLAKGVVRVRVDQTFALRDAAEAHRALESRRTTGATVLVP